MRQVTLNALRAGIERQRSKGGAKPDALYDLVNGYVTIDGAVHSRPGTSQKVDLRAAGASAGATKGLCAFDGRLVVFSHQQQSMPSTTPGVECEVLVHPTIPGLALAEIHFAGPFLNYLYVVAEFTNGDVFHYWLQRRDTWTAGKFYRDGDVVEPTVRNGLAYRARRIDAAAPPWAPDVMRTVGDVIEPTVANGFRYTVIDTLGDAPKSGKTEPTWPASNGATVTEDTDLAPPVSSTPTDPTTQLPPDVVDRYGGGGSSRFGGTFETSAL